MMEEALGEAKLQLEKEEEELENAISGIATQVSSIASVVYLCCLLIIILKIILTTAGFSGNFRLQTKEIEDKILQFEEFDLQMERKWQQFQQLQNRLFVDQLTVLFHKTAAPKTGENIGESVKTE